MWHLFYGNYNRFCKSNSTQSDNYITIITDIDNFSSVARALAN